jgi:hypothetical protein
LQTGQIKIHADLFLFFFDSLAQRAVVPQIFQAGKTAELAGIVVKTNPHSEQFLVSADNLGKDGHRFSPLFLSFEKLKNR